MKAAKTVGAYVVFLVAMVGGLAWGGVEGSKHDFSSQSWSGGNACAACHSPQHDQDPDAAPLWDQNADLNRRFGTSLTRSKEAGLGTIICLRCHDGTIAKDTIAAATRERFVNQENPGLFGAGHGTSEHPVGVPYPLFNLGFRPATLVVANGTVTLPGGRVECISCHDPHDELGLDHMLVTSNNRSALCLTCHNK